MADLIPVNDKQRRQQYLLRMGVALVVLQKLRGQRWDLSRDVGT